uniref:Uncharacterized protein n=1 Tax=viral metagenome TaxID=1070528 RepID=A0A6M3Y4J1_9ZZZZ
MRFKKAKIKLRDENTREAFSVDGYRMDLGLYNTWVDVVFGQIKQMKRFRDGGWGESGWTWTSNENDEHMVWLKDKKLSTLVHETNHLVNRISKARGLSDDDRNEQQAYLQTWLFNKIKELK